MIRDNFKIYLGKLSGIAVVCLSGVLLYIANEMGEDVKTGIFVRDSTYLLFYLAVGIALIIAILEFSIAFGLNIKIKGLINSVKENNFHSSPWAICLKIASFFYSEKNRKQLFEPIVADWREEYFEALFKKETWKARWINVRYTYAFLAAMWQKSPIGDLIEFISKLAK